MIGERMRIGLVSIVIPAYNEEAAIGGDLRVILDTMDASGRDYEVIVVDDGSTDDTARIVESFQGVKLVSHNRNRGGGYSRNTGIREAEGEVIVITDGDGTYPNHEIPRLLDMMEEHNLDMVIGARSKEAGSVRMLRAPVKLFIRKLAEFMSGFKIPDLNSGLRAFKKDVYMKYRELLPWGHSWVSTITLAMLSGGYEVDFLRVDYYRRKGKSTFHPVKDTMAYLSLVVRTVTWFNPLKVFMPIALLIAALGTYWLVVDIINWDVRVATVMLILAAIQIAAIGLLADLIARRGG